MKRDYVKIIIKSLLIAIIGIWAIDYFSHLLFSNPMETTSYFLGKMTLYIIFSIIFLLVFDLRRYEFIKVLVAGIVVASIWGLYYNVLPTIFHYYPYGIALRGLTFLGMGIFATGVAFGTIHTFAFLGGYYITKLLFRIFNSD